MNLPRITMKSKIVRKRKEQMKKNSRVGGWGGQAMAVNKKQLPALTCHMTSTHSQTPAVFEKNIFHLFRSTQPVEIASNSPIPIRVQLYNSEDHVNIIILRTCFVLLIV